MEVGGDMKGAATISISLALTGIGSALILVTGAVWNLYSQVSTVSSANAATQAQVTTQGTQFSAEISTLNSNVEAVNTNIDTLLESKGIQPVLPKK